jgi:hypothetical protein
MAETIEAGIFVFSRQALEILPELVVGRLWLRLCLWLGLWLRHEWPQIRQPCCYALGKFLPLEWMAIRMYKRKRIYKQIGR